MRRRLLLGLGGALLVTMCGVGSAQADNGPHVSPAAGVGFNQLVGTHGCSSCHRANTSRAAFMTSSGQVDLCLTCHGSFAGGSTTDVVDGVSYAGVGAVVGPRNRNAGTAPAALRGGGFDYALIASAAATKDTYLVDSTIRARNQVIPVLAAPQVVTSRHGTGMSTAWGNSAINSDAGDTVSLECSSCHDPHGNGSYRVLRSSPVSPGASAAAGVKIPDGTVKVYSTTNYWKSGDTSVPDGYTANVTAWCTTCHEGAHVGTTTKMIGTTCATCHVAHGSNATEGGASSSPASQPDGSAAPYQSSLLRVDSGEAICTMCHSR